MATGINAVNAQLAAMGAKAQGAGNSFRSLDPAAAAMSRLAREAKEAERALKNVASASDHAAKQSDKFGSSASSVAKGGVAAFAIIKAWEMVAANIGKAIEAADEYTRIESRLRQVSGGAAGAAELQKELYTVAQESRQSFFELANTYAQVARSTKELGISQTELLNITKSVSQAVTLSGASTQAAKAAMIQFSQAMASGVLRGEELRSVMEQTPRLALAIANGLGVGIGELRKLGEQGELTAQKVLGAIAKSASDIDREFKSMTPTVADGFTKLANSGQNFVDVLNDATGASKLLYRTLNALSGAMDVTAQGVKTGVQNAKTGVLEAEIARLKTQIGSIGKDDFRLSGLQSQLDAKQVDLYKLRGTGLAGGAEMPVLSNPAAKGASAEYLALTQKMSGVSADFYKNLKILNEEYSRTGNLKQYQEEVQKLIETETQIGKDSIKKPRTVGGGGKTAAAQASEEAKAYQDAMKGLASVNANAQKSTLELSAAQSTLYDLMTSPAWATMPEAWKQTAVAQFESARAAEMQAEKFRDHAKAMEEGRRVMESMRTPEEALASEIVNLNRLLDEGAISWDVYARAVFAAQDKLDGTAKKVEETSNEMDEFAKSAAKNIQSSLADFLFDPFKEGLDGMLKGFGTMLQRMIAEAAAAQIANALFGDMKSGKVGGILGSIFSAVMSEKGNAFDGGEVKKFASGGVFGNGRILTKPTMFALGGTLGVAGEAGPEGALPLKRMSNGKLGVYMSGGGGTTINQTINAGSGTDKAEVKRAAASGARTALGVIGGARRYG
jgi:tape measure domain-containing protein